VLTQAVRVSAMPSVSVERSAVVCVLFMDASLFLKPAAL
jgi:hypothetical protein